MISLARIADEETYADACPILNRLAHRFAATYGGNVDDWRDECNEIFTEEFRKWEPGRGTTFQAWLWRRVWFRLIDRIRSRTAGRHNSTNCRKAGRDEHAIVDPEILAGHVAKPAPELRLLELWDALTEDAAVLVRIVLDTPVGLLPVSPRDAKYIRRKVRQYAHAHLGWTADRIRRGFHTIEKALQ